MDSYSSVQSKLDMTLCLYQDRASWLRAVHDKFGQERADRCAQIVGLEVETMDQLEAQTGKTVAQVLREAFEPIRTQGG